jgi:hypothetical protein
MKTLATAAAAVLLGICSAHAGEVRDFEAKMRTAYADYRTALFATNSGKAEPSAKAVDAFEASWAPLAAGTAPPQYADDPAFAATMADVAAIAAAADREIAAGDLAKAHATLEGIREAIGDLHGRNGVIGFSDRMNAYHARMEHVIGMDASDPAAIAAEAAVLAYLLADVTAHPPAEADESFKDLAAAVEVSVAKLKDAAAAADEAAIKAAVGGLKAPYSKLFLKFG